MTDFGMARNVQQDDIYTRKSRVRVENINNVKGVLLLMIFLINLEFWFSNTKYHFYCECCLTTGILIFLFIGPTSCEVDSL